MKTVLRALISIGLLLGAFRAIAQQQASPAKTIPRLDQLYVEDGGERLHFACRSEAGREMELQATQGAFNDVRTFGE
jgi:hypothetical protein